jgi:hypothetical protein
MLTVEGMYQDGKVTIKDNIWAIKPVKVIVTFLEEVNIPEKRRINLEHFSFNRSKKILENYQGSLSDVIVEERRSAL